MVADSVKDPDRLAEPVWAIAKLFPDQGQWSEEEYLALETNRLVEFAHGHIEVLPLPTQKHRMMIGLLYRLLFNFVGGQSLGVVLMAALRVQLWRGKYREPDVVFMRAENDHRRHEVYWEGADLVIEVVSEGAENRERDLITKRREYAQAGIPEYWIVDPETKTVTALHLVHEHYQEHGIFSPGENATSILLPGFTVAVSEIFNVN